MAGKDNKQKQDVNEILKRIQEQSPSQKKKKTIEILTGNNKPITEENTSFSFLQTAKNIFEGNKQIFLRKIRNQQNQKLFLLTAFFAFSTYIAYRIQSKYDLMRQKATKTKTFKQAQIQKQDIMINNYLSKNQFQPVPITNQPQIKNNYKYEEQSAYFDSREDFYEGVAKDFRSGYDISPDMEKQLKDKGFL